MAACREILDRAYGKAMQPIQGTVDYGISEQLAELFRGTEGNTLGAEIGVALIKIAAPANAITSYATLTWSEIGKPGN